MQFCYAALHRYIDEEVDMEIVSRAAVGKTRCRCRVSVEMTVSASDSTGTARAQEPP